MTAGSVHITYELTSLDPSVLDQAKSNIDARILAGDRWQYSSSDGSHLYKLLTNNVVVSMHLVSELTEESLDILQIVIVISVAVVAIGIVFGVCYAVYLCRKKQPLRPRSVTLEQSQDGVGLHTPITPGDGNADKAMEMMTTIHEAGFPYIAPTNDQEENDPFAD